MFVLRVEGSGKKCGPPPLRVISGTALRLLLMLIVTADPIWGNAYGLDGALMSHVRDAEAGPRTPEPHRNRTSVRGITNKEWT